MGSASVTWCRTPFLTAFFGGLDIFRVEELDLKIPPRQKSRRPVHRLRTELDENDAEAVAYSRITWLWPRRVAILLATLAAVIVTAIISSSPLAILAMVLEVGFGYLAWIYLYAFWWGDGFDYTRSAVIQRRGVFAPEAVGSIGGESIDKVRGKRYFLASLFRLDVGWVEIVENDGSSTRRKHVPCWSVVFPTIQAIDKSGGQSEVQANTRLSVKALFMTGVLSYEDIVAELGQDRADEWQRQKNDRSRAPRLGGRYARNRARRPGGSRPGGTPPDTKPLLK